MIWAEIGTMVAIVGIVYAFLRNFKTDICSRMDKTEARLTSLEERIFYVATGKTLAEAMMLEKKKEE